VKTISDLINYLDSIPEDMWITGSLCSDPKEATKKQAGCAMGHINFALSGSYLRSSLGDEGFPTRSYVESLGIDSYKVVRLNNGDYTTGGTPKQRVLSYLRETVGKQILKQIPQNEALQMAGRETEGNTIQEVLLPVLETW